MKKISTISLAAIILLSPVSILAQEKSQMLELMQQLTRLEKEVRQLRGEVERLGYENRRLKNQQNDLYLDLDQRIKKVETTQPGSQLVSVPPANTASLAVNPAATGVSPVTLESVATPGSTQPTIVPVIDPSRVSTAAPVPVRTILPVPVVAADPAQEEASYKSAFNLLKVGKYEEAIVSYSDFLMKYPNGKYAANAQYWLGEANYVRRQFPLAIAEFKKVIANYPESRKLPDAMLKIGYIHYELKETDAARQVLTELKQKYPGTTASRLADNRLQRMKLEGK